MSEQSKKPSPEQQQSKEKVEDLNQKPITDRDAQYVKGGMASAKKK